MAKLTLTDIAAGYALIATINANNTLIETALENTLSRDGTTPNTLSAALDMNSNLINNLTDGVQPQDAVTLSQLTDVIAVGTPSLGAIPDVSLTLAAKGDLLVFDGSNWVDLTVGTNGQALTADSAADTGLSWGSGGADLTADETITGNWTVDNATGFGWVNDAGDRELTISWPTDFNPQLLVSNAAGTGFWIKGVEQLHILTHNASNNNQLLVYGGNSTVTSERIKLQHTGTGGSGQLLADSSHINIIPSSDGNGFVTVGSSAVHSAYGGGPMDSDGALTVTSQTNLDAIEVGCQILEGSNNPKCRMFLSDQDTAWGFQAVGDVTIPVFRMYQGNTTIVTAEFDYFRIDNGAELRVADSSETDWIAQSHDGTDYNFDFVNTAVMNINGRTLLRSYAVEQHTETSAANALIIDMALGNAVDYTLTENLTGFTITNIPPAGTYGEIWLKIIQHASSVKTITWPAAFKFSGGTDHIMTAVIDAVDLIHLQTIDGGTTWYCSFHNDMS